MFFAFLVSLLAKSDDFQSAVEALRRLPPLARAVFALVVSGAIVFGGSKPSGTISYDFINWFTSGAPDGGPVLSGAQKAAGFALVAADTNVVFDFSAPTNATVHEAWLKRGAAVDGFLLNPESWSFTFGTDTVDSAYVSSSGAIAFGGRRRTSPEGPGPGSRRMTCAGFCACCPSSSPDPDCLCGLCHPSGGEPLLYNGSHDGRGGMLVSVNNDDGVGTADRNDPDMPVWDDGLLEYFPLGMYSGACCPCPGHMPSPADTATLVSAPAEQKALSAAPR